MPKKAKAPRRTPEKPAINLLLIRCASCGLGSSVNLPGPAPWPGAVFTDKRWTVLNEPEDGHVVFACGDCFEKEMNSSNSGIRGESPI